MKNDKYIYNEKMERNDEKQSIKNEFFNARVSCKINDVYQIVIRCIQIFKNYMQSNIIRPLIYAHQTYNVYQGVSCRSTRRIRITKGKTRFD